MPVNILDIIILLVVAVGMLHGFSTGAIRQVASVASLVVAFFVGLGFMDSVSTFLVRSLDVAPSLAPAIAFILIFILIQLLIFTIVKFVEAVVGALKLTILNRIGGGVIGAVKGGLFVSLVLLVIGFLDMPGERAKEDSRLYPAAVGFLPDSWQFLQDQFPGIRSLPERFGRADPGADSAPPETGSE